MHRSLNTAHSQLVFRISEIMEMRSKSVIHNPVTGNHRIIIIGM